jgi:hypothetical protein
MGLQLPAPQKFYQGIFSEHQYTQICCAGDIKYILQRKW